MVLLWFENNMRFGNTRNRDGDGHADADKFSVAMYAAASHHSAQTPALDRCAAYCAYEQFSPVPACSTAVSVLAKARSIYSRLLNAYECFSKVFVSVLSSVKEHGAIFRLGLTAVRSLPVGYGT